MKSPYELSEKFESLLAAERNMTPGYHAICFVDPCCDI
jgi:hypothetical protein